MSLVKRRAKNPGCDEPFFSTFFPLLCNLTHATRTTQTIPVNVLATGLVVVVMVVQMCGNQTNKKNNIANRVYFVFSSSFPRFGLRRGYSRNNVLFDGMERRWFIIL